MFENWKVAGSFVQFAWWFLLILYIKASSIVKYHLLIFQDGNKYNMTCPRSSDVRRLIHGSGLHILFICFTVFFLSDKNLSCKLDSQSTYIYIFHLHNVAHYLKEIELITEFTFVCVCVFQDREVGEIHREWQAAKDQKFKSNLLRNLHPYMELPGHPIFLFLSWNL